MLNQHPKHLLLTVLLLLLAGCASDTTKPPESTAGQIYQQGAIAPLHTYPLPNPPAFSQQPNLPEQSAGRYAANAVSGTYAQSLGVRSFIKKMVQQHGFSESYLNGLFSTANRLDSVIRLENPLPSTGPSKPSPGSWTRYRNKFLTEAHIANGVEFWRNNHAAIQRASSTYGVDPEYIVGIIGVETYFGKNFGKTCVFDALTTLSFDTYRRSQYFTSELENFLLMTRDEGFDPRKPQGSWAGAMGYGQFMPSSSRRLAVDFNQDGRRDLWDPQDAIGSVAHYFSRSGWQYHNPVTQPGSPASNPAIIELSTNQGPEYWYIHPNFKVIKKYNNSNKYAMAVHQLAKAIKQRYTPS